VVLECLASSRGARYGSATARDNESMDSVWQSALVVLQAFQLAFLLVHDWIPLGPLNDVRAVRRENTMRQLVIGTAVSSAPVALALWLSVRYYGQSYPAWVKVWLWLTYGLLFAGELQAWWIPYLVRRDAKRAARYQSMFGHTHAFLPERNGIAPNTLHVSLSPGHARNPPCPYPTQRVRHQRKPIHRLCYLNAEGGLFWLFASNGRTRREVNRHLIA
jgi:hypothetical protein